MRKHLLATAAAAALIAGCLPALADMDAAKKWVDTEFQPSALSKEEQIKEMQWFVGAAQPFKGMDIKVVSETITTHEYESKTLAKAFFEITGIKVTHDIIGEGGVVAMGDEHLDGCGVGERAARPAGGVRRGRAGRRRRARPSRCHRRGASARPPPGRRHGPGTRSPSRRRSPSP